MNRFVLDTDPAVAAVYHCDKHVVKMILEEAQMLCAVQRRYGSEDERLYRATHAKHPCTLWAGETVANYQWAYSLLVALCKEYTHRYKKQHATERLLDILSTPPDGLPEGPLIPFAQAMPEEYKRDDPVEAYRAYYLGEKAGFAKWTARDIPEWFLTEDLGLCA